MPASPQLAHPAEVSPRLQRRRTAANAAADSPISKRSTRPTRTPDKITELEANVVVDRNARNSSGKRKKGEAVLTEEAPPQLPKGAAPKKTRQRKEAEQETEETTQEQEPAVEEASTKAKRKRKVDEDQKPADPQVDGGGSKTIKRKKVVKVEEEEAGVGEPVPKKIKRKEVTEAEIDEIVEDDASPKKAKRKTKVKEEDEEIQEGEGGQKIIKRKRKTKTKAEKELEAMPLAVRTDGLRMFIGAHVSGAKGWSFRRYIASVELRLFFESRNPQFSHKLRAHWVNNFQIIPK